MSTSSGAPESWISSFCSLLGHEYFAEVSEEFIEDDFNLTGLQSQVPMYKEALEMILDVEPEEDEEEVEEDEDEEEEEEEEEDNDAVMRGEGGERLPSSYRRASERRQLHDLGVIESSAELLYGLIHQRYITSRPGMQQMADKYELQHFGACPRVYCNGARVVPVGCSDTPGVETVKLFCPSCLDIYTPPNSRFQSVDGAFFGTTFGYLFFMSFPEYDVSVKGDPLNLSAINAERAPETKSRSSSLTSTPVPIPTAASADPAPPPPLPPQPTTINGTPTANLAPGLGPGKIHENRIYGFRVAERARTGPRMKWLRDKPADCNALDESARYHEQYGGDPEGEVFSNHGTNGTSHLEQLSRRKKAPVRRRRKVVAEGAANGAGGDAG
ncbi:MAG: hypothetical protein Q9219_003401 [cf. Caloplaca sp. 3 TL-2023]